MTKPDLRVIDEAIRIVQNHGRWNDNFSCIALYKAEKKVTRRKLKYYLMSEYVRQYTWWMRRSGHHPYWWNSSNLYTAERVAALRSFRQACIDAAKKGKK